MTFIYLILYIALQFIQSSDVFLSNPDIFLLGAAKSGTTSLTSLLRSNSWICNHGKKEKHYFDSWRNKTHTNIQYYLNEFKDCKSTQKSLDATPAYIRTQLTPILIRQYYTPFDLQSKKFIIILREPISRAFSWYGHGYYECNRRFRYRGTYNKHFADTWGCNERILNISRKYSDSFDNYVQEKRIHIEDGFYFQQIKQWLKYIPNRSQYFILNMDYLLKNTEDAIVRLTRFIGIPENSWVGINITQLPKSNVIPTKFDRFGRPHKMNCKIFEDLYAAYHSENIKLYGYMNTSKSFRPRDEPEFGVFNNDNIRLRCSSS